MPTLQVRDLPMAIYETLKTEAQKKHRSLAQQTIITLAKGLEKPLDNKQRRAKVIEEIESHTDDKFKDLPDPVKLIREDRER